MSLIFYLCIIGFSLFLTRLMMAINIQDIPCERSSHSMSIPRAGGVAVMGAIFFGIGWLVFVKDDSWVISTAVYAMLTGGLIMGIMGLWDDITSTHFTTRLFIQTTCAVLCVYSGITISYLSFPFVGAIHLGQSSALVTVLWIMGFTNAFNFYDGLNGLSSGTAILILGLLNFFLPSDAGIFNSILLQLFACAIFGFFVFNFPLLPRASSAIFLGDSGSQFIGFCLACLPLVINCQGPAIFSSYMMPLLFFCPLWDIILTLIRRLIGGKNITKPHREHLFQLLQRSGWSHQQVSLLYYAFTFLQGIGAWFLSTLSENYQWIVFIPYIFLQTFYSYCVLKRAKKHQLLP